MNTNLVHIVKQAEVPAVPLPQTVRLGELLLTLSGHSGYVHSAATVPMGGASSPLRMMAP
jgi:hypothetical protein